MLRIVVSTANPMDHNWQDIENTVWIHGVPRWSSPIPQELKADDFPSKLESVLYAINVAPAVASLVSISVRRPCMCSCLVKLIRCSQACQQAQHSTQYCLSRCASHALGILPRTRNTYPEHRREALGLACCYQAGTYNLHARRQPAKPTAACHPVPCVSWKCFIGLEGYSLLPAQTW